MTKYPRNDQGIICSLSHHKNFFFKSREYIISKKFQNSHYISKSKIKQLWTFLGPNNLTICLPPPFLIFSLINGKYVPDIVLGCILLLPGYLAALVVDDKVLFLCDHGAQLRNLVADRLLLLFVLNRRIIDKRKYFFIFPIFIFFMM